ncbi:hypothetical protein CI109_106129 [Kwoniella shandongensis]|uniref:Uncharacterized protein n=1 Tax=Kwoniella shandongensis TaxID=1734106 RepID=A0A5M6BY70_9TREE|nr:uncharacterized protein CI109_003735 [Kwoniella shandongensis]KAA5527764.1 hypothetical protein CI109_003735 [Kwoniella shandongensis]
MPTVEDYFDDDTDLPLPSSSSKTLPHLGERGALLEEITSEDEVDMDMDYNRLAEQSRGVFGENAKAPPPSSSNNKGKLAVRDDSGELRPTGPGGAGGPNINPNTPMGGFMGDMMKLQAAEDERMEKLKKQFGNASVAGDPSVYKGWNTVYPLYFDAKVSINEGRRVPRKSALWWPQAQQIAQACRSLGLPSVLEPDRVHPADWENPGRVKVQFEKEGRLLNPIVKNRTQLYKHIADQMRQRYPSIAFNPSTTPSKRASKPAAPVPTSNTTKSKSAKSKGSSSKSSKKALTKVSTPTPPPPRLPTRPPLAPQPIPVIDDRLPLHSPVIPAGVAVAAIKRDKESEKEAKKKGVGMGGGGGGAIEDGEKKEKQPKMKRVVVRGKR